MYRQTSVLGVCVLSLNWNNTVLSVIAVSLGQVIELDDSFESKRGDGAWLVEFYAPWCGHCRKLEPEYHRVSIDLRGANIHVAKVDATRFSGLAHTYEVRGYPTIKFIEGDQVFTHQGDRSKEGIIEFAKRAKGPHVKQVKNVGKFNQFRGDHSDSVFFMYIGAEGTQLLTSFEAVAKKFAIYSYFYQGEQRVLPKDISLAHDPTVLCFKDGAVYEYQPDESQEDSLEIWFTSERYAVFPKVGGGGVNEMANMGKRLVIVVTDDKQTDTKAQQTKFKDAVKSFAQQKRTTYHDQYQFLWMGDPSTMEQVTMMDIQVPCLLVLDPATHEYYVPDFTADQFSSASLDTFLQDVQNGESQGHGGTGILQRFKRLGFDIKSLVVGIYKESVWLALVVFGVPTFVISLLCYGLCCMQPLDEDEFADEIDGDGRKDGDRDSDDSEEEQSPPLYDAATEQHHLKTE